MPSSLRLSIVSDLWIRVKIVLKPVAIVSAVSRVVARTDVNKAINSFSLPPAASNTPPVLLTTEIRSADSTAKLLETALIESIAISKN